MSKKRLEYMDMVKGVGILGIVVMHSTTVPLQAIWWISSVAPPLFFLSSGMLAGYTKEPEEGKGGAGGKGALFIAAVFLFQPALYSAGSFAGVYGDFRYRGSMAGAE